MRIQVGAIPEPLLALVLPHHTLTQLTANTALPLLKSVVVSWVFTSATFFLTTPWSTRFSHMFMLFSAAGLSSARWPLASIKSWPLLPYGVRNVQTAPSIGALDRKSL